MVCPLGGGVHSGELLGGLGAPTSSGGSCSPVPPSLSILSNSPVKKFKRRVLKLADDPNGNVFIKGLKKICVKNSDEAYRVMLAGNLIYIHTGKGEVKRTWVTSRSLEAF